MIRHIVFFTAKDKAHVDKIVDGLSVLAKIPHARRLEVARNRNSDRLGNEIDVIVYGEFDDEVELEAYKAHELYQESIRQVRPLRELRLAAELQHVNRCGAIWQALPAGVINLVGTRGFWCP
ncbi:Dabb family protein (plasmid) [Bradyrhizobium sp. 187]|nr:Dabb family protein [Bradyrhizobium sp. 187]UPJ77153.1 Dabb family protein [Bradyrhizobium sp. 187]